MSTSGAWLAWVDRDSWLIIAARSSRSFGQSAVAVLVAIYLGLKGFSLVEVGLFLTAGSLGATVAALVAGTFGDKLGRRRTLVALSTLMAVSGIALALSSNFTILVAAAFIGGLSGFAGAGGVGPLETAVLATAATPQRRTDLFALFNVLGTVAVSLGALASGLPIALQRWVGMTEVDSFRVWFVVYSVLVVFSGLLYTRLSAKLEQDGSGARWTNPFTLPSRRRIFGLSGLFVVDSFGTGLLVQSLASYWFYTRFGLEANQLGLLFFSSSVLTAVSIWAAARIARRIGLVNTMVFTHIPASVLLIAVPFVPSVWIAVALWLVRAFFIQMDVPTSQSYTMAIVGSQERTAMASATTVSRSAGVAVGPSVGTALWTALGPAATFIVGGAVKIGYDLTLWYLFRKVKAPEELGTSERPKGQGRTER